MRETILQQIERRIALNDRRYLLRPMLRQEIIDLATSIYRRLGPQILRISAFPSFCAYCVIVYFWSFVLPGFFTTSNPESQSHQVQEVVVAVSLTVFAAIPLFLLSTSLIGASVSRLVAAHLMDERLDPLELGRMSPRLVWRTVLVQLYGIAPCLIVFALAIGLLLFSAFWRTDQEFWNAMISLVGFAGIVATFVILPITANRIALAPVVLAREDATARQAIARSRELQKRTAYHPGGTEVFSSVWSLCILVALVVVIGSGAIFSIAEAEPTLQQWTGASAYGEIVVKIVGMLPVYLAVLTVVPAWAVVSTVVYFERRIRLEGLDIELLTQDAKKSRRAIRFMP